MTVSLPVAEGFAIASGLLMVGAGSLLWRHHGMRPAWGFRWLALALGLAAVTNILAPLLITMAWITGYSSAVGFITLTVGFGSLMALVVGIQFYVLRPPQHPWRLFLLLWVSSQVATVAAVVLGGIRPAGDLIAVAVFIYGAGLAAGAARREPRVGHALLGLTFLAQPLTLAGLALAGLDAQAARYLSAVPYAMVGLVLLSASLVRLRSDLVREFQARSEAEAAARETRAALQRSHAVQQALLQQAPVPLAFTPVVDGWVPRSYWNEAWYRCFGHEPGSKEGLGGADFDFYVDPQARERYMRKVLTQGHEGPFEVRLRHASGAERLCVMQGNVIESDEGPFLVSTFIDITEQRANELHLREFEAMVQSAEDGILFIEQGRITAANPGAQKMFGASAQQLVGSSPVDWSPELQADGRSSTEAAAALIEATLAGQPQRFHWLHRRASGEVFTVQISLAAVEAIPGRLAAVLRDVSEDLARSQALARSEARFKSIIAVSNTGAWEYHGDTQYLWCSPEYFTMLGYDPADFPMDGRANLQQTWVALMHPDDASPSAKRFADYLEAGSPGLYESYFRMRHAEGRWVWIWSRGQTLRNADGSLTDLTVGTHIDITEKKLSEEQLHKARQMAEAIARAQLQFIVQSDRRKSFDGLLADILALADSEYGFIGEVLFDAEARPYLKTFAITNIAWNDSSRAFYEANAPRGMEFTNLKTLFGQAMVTGKPVIANAPYEDPRRGGLPQGHPALNAFLGVPVFHGETLVAMFGISNRPGGYDEDILEYLHPLTATIGQLVVAHRGQVRQRETELRLESISNNLPNSMVYQLDCGEDGHARRFTYLSAGVQHLHGLAPEAVLRDARLLYAQIHPEDLPRLAAKEAECTQAMREFNTEYRGRGPAGEERWFYLSSTPTRNADNHIVWDGIELDITERKEAERRLAELNQNLESRVEARTWELTQALNDLNRTQQDLIQSEKLAALGGLVAGVAHELNTPIGNAVTVASTLADAEAKMREKLVTGLTRSALQEFLDTVGEAGGMLSRNLTRAVNLVTSFKQVAVDQNNHQRRDYELQEILSEVQIVMAPSLRKAHVLLELDLRENPGMDGYPGALSQVLMILISNAITHAFEGRDGGKVCISAGVAPASGPGWVQIVVADDGVGIAAASLGRIFEPFYTTKLGKGGSGLGLHIGYNVVTGTLGGRISAESQPGQGTRMILDLPLKAPQAAAAPATKLP